MSVYIFLVIFCFVLSFAKQTKLVERAAFIVAAFILCFGYMTGSDWRTYELIYYNKWGYDHEFLYKLLNDICYAIGIGFWPFFITFKIILLAVIFNVYRRLGIPLLFCLMLFIPTMGFYLFIDNPMRNLIAYTIFAYCTKYIVSREFFKYLVGITIAFFFHYTTIAVLPIYFLYNVNFKNRTLIILYVLINIFFASQKVVLGTMEYIASYLPAIGDRMLYYLETHIANPDSGDFKNKIFSVSILVKTFGFIVLLYYKNRLIEKFKYGKLVFVLSMCYLLLYRVSLSFLLFTRITLFFDIFYICAIGYVLLLLSVKSRMIVKVFVCLYALVITYRVTSDSYKYIPYTNYLIYKIKGHNLSFEERDSYNFENGPYYIKGSEPGH